MKSSTLLNPVIKSKEKIRIIGEDFFNPADVAWKTVTREKYYADKAAASTVLLSLGINLTQGKYSSKQLTFRITRDIIDKLKWSDGDRISLFYGENDLSKMMLVKATTGYLLRMETWSKTSTNPFFKVSVRASFLSNDQPFKGMELKSKIDQGRLLLQGNF